MAIRKIPRNGGLMARKKKSTKSTKSVEAVDYPSGMGEWETKEGMRTLMRAQEITSNKSLMSKIKAHAKKESETAARVARLDGKLL